MIDATGMRCDMHNYILNMPNYILKLHLYAKCAVVPIIPTIVTSHLLNLQLTAILYVASFLWLQSHRVCALDDP